MNVKQEVDLKTLHVSAGVRYWEDAEVNGIVDVDGDRIPCRVGNRWCPEIDIETGVIKNWIKGVTANIHYKICDDGVYSFWGSEGKPVIVKNSYVLACLSPEEDGFGDYIIMSVNEEGLIRGWDKDSVIDLLDIDRDTE